MGNVVNSAETLLEAPQVVIEFAGQYRDSGLPGADMSVEATLAAIVREITMPDTDLKQFGNTAFIGHRGKGNNKNIMVGRALNVDTASNFYKNGLEYIEYLREAGIEYYRTDFYNKQSLSLMKRWHKLLTGRGDELDVVSLSDGGYRAFLVLKQREAN